MSKERAGWVTKEARGTGVVELIDWIITSDLSELEAKVERH